MPRCDTNLGPCSCGAWHKAPAPPAGARLYHDPAAYHDPERPWATAEDLRRQHDKRQEALAEIHRARLALQAAAYALDLAGDGGAAGRARAVDVLVRDVLGVK